MLQQKVSTSVNEGIKYFVKSGKGKLAEVRMERDLFRSIRYFALPRKSDLEEVHTYPERPILLSLCHILCRMNKNTYEHIIKELEKSGVLNNLEMVDVVIADEMCFFCISFPIYLKHLALLVDLYCVLCSSFSVKRIDLAFDTIVIPPIKDN